MDPWVLAAILVATVDVVAWVLAFQIGFHVELYFGIDYDTYMAAAASFVRGTGFYEPYQLLGPYGTEAMPILYPPSAIPLFAAFTVLPGFLWWAIPLGVLAYRLPRDRCLWLVLALLAWPQSVMLSLAGNPVIWVALFLALGFGPLVMLKPTLAPFALLGMRSRRWWIGAAAMLVLTVAFLPMLPDYLTVLANVTGTSSLYVVGNVPIMLIGWLARGRGRASGSDWIAEGPIERDGHRVLHRDVVGDEVAVGAVDMERQRAREVARADERSIRVVHRSRESGTERETRLV